MSDGDRKVRVRGGPKGVRHISLDDWKREILERKGELPPATSPRQRKQLDKATARRERQARKREKAT